MNELSKYIYDNTINVILSDFEENEQDELLACYKSYLIENYKNTMKLSNDIEKLKEFFCKSEIEKWKLKSKEEKQYLLLPDENFNRIGYLSQLAYDYAHSRLKGDCDKLDLTEKKVDEYINEMMLLVDKVRDFNKNVALQLCSEGIIDFKYAINSTDNMSLRIARLNPKSGKEM